MGDKHIRQLAAMRLAAFRPYSFASCDFPQGAIPDLKYALSRANNVTSSACADSDEAPGALSLQSIPDLRDLL